MLYDIVTNVIASFYYPLHYHVNKQMFMLKQAHSINSFMQQTYPPLLFFFLLLINTSAYAVTLEKTIAAQEKVHQAATAAQQEVDKLANETTDIVNEYQQVMAEIKQLTDYHAQLQRLNNQQQQKLAIQQQQLATLTTTQQALPPLLPRMLSVLQQFIALDKPFLQEERQTRLTQLQQMLDQTDLNETEKYHRLIEAYQIEVGYGYNVEAYQGELNTDTVRTVEFLRFGRLGLYYLSLDQQQLGYWNAAEKKWQALDEEYRTPLIQALRVAKKHSAPDFIQLPIPLPQTQKTTQEDK